MKQAQRIKRAQEEIGNCNVEVRRLHTHVLDESADLHKIVDTLKAQNHPIAGAVEEFSLHRQWANTYILNGIYDIFGLSGFSGDETPGVRVGRVADLTWSGVARGKEANQEEEEDNNYDLDEDEEARGEYGGLVDFVSDMPLRNS
jgi:hypothetical protein